MFLLNAGLAAFATVVSILMVPVKEEDLSAGEDGDSRPVERQDVDMGDLPAQASESSKGDVGRLY
jgi:hypothetical protein